LHASGKQDCVVVGESEMERARARKMEERQRGAAERLGGRERTGLDRRYRSQNSVQSNFKSRVLLSRSVESWAIYSAASTAL